MLTYCTRCFYPNTKPDIWFKDGLCSACIAYDARAQIDWKQRELEFVELVAYYKSLRCMYDCVIPVSGGKDSTYQVVRALEYGLRPLAVTASTDHLSVIGRANLDNIAKLGVDHIEVSTDAKLRRRINKYTLETVGDISWAEHVTIFTIPVRMAIKFDVPLIIWGENPQNEYGGPQSAQQARKLDQRWLEEYGGLNGLRVSDLTPEALGGQYQKEEIQRKLHLYTYPNLSEKTTNGIFLGQFFPWNGMDNAFVAQQNGFKFWYGPVEGSGFPYENLDNYQTGIHDYFKYLKFGFGRATDITSNYIRRGIIDRREARQILIQYDGQFPHTYLGTPLRDILNKIDLTERRFLEIVNEFANPALFKIENGAIPKPLFKEALRNA